MESDGVDIMGLVWGDSSITVYDTASGTITFNDSDVQRVFIEWGDGTDQTLENGIHQWDTLEGTRTTADVTHVYTKAGSYNVLIRTINSQGILSKYYGSSAAAPTGVYPYEQNESIAPLTVADGAPTSLLRIENKHVLSGIDNNIFSEGAKDVYIQIAPILDSGVSSDLKSKTLKIKAEVVEAIRQINVNTVDATASPLPLGLQRVTRTIEQTFAINDRLVAGSGDVILLNNSERPLLGINKVSLMTVKMPTVYNDTANDDFNKLKIFLIAKGDDGSFYPITYVSNGDPVKSLGDNKRQVTLDFSQSRSKASNKVPSYYKFDSGKGFWEPSDQWQASSSTTLTDTTKTVDTLIKDQYTYYTRPDGLTGVSPVDSSGTIALTSGNAFIYGATDGFIRDQFLINEFNQFYDSYHLARITTTSDSGLSSDTSTFNAAYRIQPPYNAKGKTSGDQSALFVNAAKVTSWMYNINANTKNYTDKAYYNTNAYLLSTSGWNSGSFYDMASGSRDASEYLFLANDTKFDKVFFNTSAYALNLMTDLSGMTGNIIEGVFYLRLTNDKYGDKFTQKAEWVPLEFTDHTRIEKVYRDSGSSTYSNKTNSLARSGYISFDKPSDWSKVSMADLCGGFFDVSGQAISVTHTPNDYSIRVGTNVDGNRLGTVNPANVSGNRFSWIHVTGALIGTALADYTDDDIGAYKYLFDVSGTNSYAGRTFWVASSSIAGSPPSLYLASGASINNGVGEATVPAGFMRRINVYDVFDGVGKTQGKWADVPQQSEGAGTYAWPYQFMFGAPITTGFTRPITPAQVSGNVKNTYPLKIVLSGAALRQAPGKPGTELWNILPADNSASQIIKQTDNTAYDINYVGITSDVSVTFAGTFYQAISKNGKVFIVRTGTPIQNITLSSKAMGDEQSFSYSDNFTSYSALKKFRDIEANGIRVMWDEQQKDATWVRYFGYIISVQQTHSVQGKRASVNFSGNLVVEEICLLDTSGDLITDIIPLGGIADARNFT